MNPDGWDHAGHHHEPGDEPHEHPIVQLAELFQRLAIAHVVLADNDPLRPSWEDVDKAQQGFLRAIGFRAQKERHPIEDLCPGCAHSVAKEHVADIGCIHQESRRRIVRQALRRAMADIEVEIERTNASVSESTAEYQMYENEYKRLVAMGQAAELCECILTPRDTQYLRERAVSI